ncbi:triose-phosphate isomerase [Shinella sumterensis]|uniref:triose-phosphate isomerase n=1 Tax=Shinella sumterensis TaxID=1967501 RepID=UPI00106EB43C|nr:triose-phosphate isomerase [Shinella sumterensis]MCD1266568.1 triose-phosphate isomerase [Shinella sumterensis]TFE95871.1 triose-phosphate isomerase [Shinella sumterensis]
MTKSLWVGTSWKMNKTLAEALAFADGLKAADGERARHVQRFILPAFTAIREVKSRLAQTSVKVGAQNMHWDDGGAWTGEISPVMLKDCNADLVEIGHSERREFFNETDEAVGRKTAAAVRHGLIPLVCVGETLAEREAGQADEVLARQVTAALALLTPAEKQVRILIAYEPVWAIGVNGIPATMDYANARHERISAVVEEAMGRRLPLLYGGSVNPANCAELVSQAHIDGLFIGRSAWTVEGYLDILSRVASTV